MTLMHPRGAPAKPSDDGSGSFAAFYTDTAVRTFDAVRCITAGDVHVAHDAVQEAYLVMLRCWPDRQGRSPDDNRRYVMGIAAKKAAYWYRQQRRQAELDDDLDVPVDEVGFAEVLDEMSMLSAVRELIARQPARRRAVAVMYFLEGLRYRDIAAALEVTESTVRTHVERLRSLMKPFVDGVTEANQGGERP